MIKFGRVSYPLIPMYLSFWTWRIYPSYLFSFKVTFCLHFILFGTEFILLIIHETQRTLLGTFLFVVDTFWSFASDQYIIGWDTRHRWDVHTRSVVSQGFCQLNMLVLICRKWQKKSMKSNLGKFFRKFNFNFLQCKKLAYFCKFWTFLSL